VELRIVLRNLDRAGVVVGLSLICTAAHAEIGNPVKRGGAYISVEGGYHNNDAPAVSTTQGETTIVKDRPSVLSSAAAGASGSTAAAASAAATPSSAAAAAMAVGNPQVAAAAASGTGSATAQVIPLFDTSRFMTADDGGYGGVTIGYGFVSPVLGVVNRIEAYGSRTSSDADQSSNGAFGLRSVDNVAAIAMAAVPAESLQVRATQDLSLTEFGLRLKSDQSMGGATLTLGAEPFYIRYDQSTRTTGALSDLFDASGTRSSDVESDMFGIQLAIEGAAPLSGPFSILGRASAGVYNIDTDAKFSSTFVMPFASYEADLSQSESRTGYRLGAEAGLRYAISSAAWLSVTGSVDYLSETPTAVLPASASDGPAHLAFDDLLDWRAGARLTFATE
jgi:hypothetical protein